MGILRIQNKVAKTPHLFSFPFDNSKLKINSKSMQTKDLIIQPPINGNRKGKFKNLIYLHYTSDSGDTDNSTTIIQKGSISETVKDKQITIQNESQIGYFLNQDAFSTRKIASYEIVNNEGKYRFKNLQFQNEILKNLFWENASYSKAYSKILKRDSLVLRDQFSGEQVGLQTFSPPFYPDAPITENSPWEKQVFLENENPLDMTLLSRLYSFQPIGFIAGSSDKIAYIEYVFEDYRMRAVDSKTEDIDSITIDLKANAKTLTKSNPTEMKEYLRGLKLTGLISISAVGQQSGKGAGFFLYDLKNQKILEWQEGSLKLETTIGNNPYTKTGRSILYTATKEQFTYLDESYKAMDYKDFQTCDTEPFKCRYQF